MKKFLSCLSIIAILTMFSPAFAAPPPGGGHGGPGRGRAGVHVPARRTPPPPPAVGHRHHRHHTSLYAGFARPGYWYYSGYGYPIIEPYDVFYPTYRVYRPYRPSYGFYINF